MRSNTSHSFGTYGLILVNSQDESERGIYNVKGIIHTHSGHTILS